MNIITLFKISFFVILLTSFISSCGTVSLYQEFLLDNFLKSKIENAAIDTSEIKDNFIKVIDSKGNEQYLIKQSLEGSKSKWKNENFEITFEGVLIKETKGLENDIYYKEHPPISSILKEILWNNEKQYQLNSWFRLTNPDTSYLIKERKFRITKNYAAYNLINNTQKECFELIEDFYVKALLWKDRNTYIICENMKVMESNFKLSPSKSLQINYYYN